MNDPAGSTHGELPEISPRAKRNVFAKLASAGGDLKSPFWIYLKGFLFLFGGALGGGLLLLEHATWKNALLLGMTVWCFCRFYYFAFYVIEHYLDGEFKFAGLGSFVWYVFTRR